MATKHKILISAPYFLPVVESYRGELEAAGCELVIAPVVERLSAEELIPLVGDIVGTVCGDDRYTAEVLDCAPRLRVISKWGTGIDSIDVAAARQRGIAVRNTPNAFSVPVADSVLGYLLAFARRGPWMTAAMKAGEWEKIPGRSLAECTLGIVGVGNVGHAVARRAAAFEMRLLGTDPRGVPAALQRETGITSASLEQLLAESDFVTLHCDLNPTSFHLINADTLARMKSSAVLINTSRGPVVDEPALCNALRVGRIAGAALDVFEVEPLPQDSPLRGFNTVALAPHNSNSSPRAWNAVHRSTVNHLLESLREVS
jgi:D-3-phosphoglycerate dehydrogenase / 2-oxoglutarate reductase